MTDKRMPPEAELTRLADGSLPAGREAELRAEVDRSPGLEAELAEQERAVAMLRGLDEPAPAGLRARIEGLATEPAVRGRRRRGLRGLVLPGATALAVLVAALVILLGGSTSAPTVPQAAHLALSASTLPAPAAAPAHPGQLAIAGAGIPFPTWSGWTVTGARRDELGGRRVTTVFYRGPGGARIGYAIASGPALSGGPTGYNASYTVGRVGSARLVTWVHDGHTCLIAGRSVSTETLLRLAHESPGATPS